MPTLKPPTLNSRPFGMPSGYDPYGDALDSFGTGMPSYMSMPGGSSQGMGGGGALSSGMGLADMVLPGVGAAGSFLTSLFAMRNANKQAELNRQQQTNLQTNSINANAAQDTQALASKESTLDPFRSRMAQIGDVAKLDRVANATTAPRRLNIGGPFARFVPQSTGGYSYQESPELTGAARAAQTSVLSGQADPSMTNPANYGKTGALDLLSIAQGTKDPRLASSMTSGAPAQGSTLGANPVADVIRNAYRQYLNRDPSDAEIQSQTGNGSFTVSDPRLQMSVENIKRAAGREGAAAAGGFTPSYMGTAA
jgi:hypothetical protein